MPETTPATSEQMAKLIDKFTELKQYFEGVRADIEAERKALQEDRKQLFEDLDDYITVRLPVTPNLLQDTKHFDKICKGEKNKSVEIIAAHSSPWSSRLYDGTQGSGSVKVVTVDQLENEGIPFGGDLARAANSPGGERPFYGTDFNVLLLDVTVTADRSNGYSALFLVLNQGCPTFTGWGKGEFTTQSAVFFNCLDQSGDIVFSPHSNMPASVDVTKEDVGKGWTYRQATRTGFGGCHQPRFTGKGRMKVAIALPYIGYGDHKGRFVWAGSVGRYSHNDVV
ncbi:MAG: hypothetical protein Q3M30_17415 [Candidatus Electrothrix sp. Rat3]|nr:hypothetical protein [Candidatus Electrothrix rattekaaiensis]